MDKQQIDVSAVYGFEAGLREGANELGRVRELAVRLEGRVAELEAALADALGLHHFERECHCPECDRIRAALAGTSGKGWLSPEEATKLQAQVATLRAVIPELMDGMDTYYATLPEGDAIYEAARAALAGTGDEVGAVVRAAVRYWQQAGQADGQAERYNALVTLMDKVADLLAKQPGVWTRD